MWVSWMENMLYARNSKDVEKSKQEFMKKFSCDDIGKFNEYFGFKIKRK